MTLPIPNSFSGQAQATTLTAGINSSDLSFDVGSVSTWFETVGDHVGYPLGTSGNFVVTLDYGTTAEEKVLCTGITGSTITIAAGGRGYDSISNSTATSHGTGATVIHTISTTVPDQANLGVTNAAAAQTTANTAVSNAAAAQSTANTAQTTANNSQIPSTAGYLAVKTTYPTLPQPLKVVGWTQSVAATLGGAGIAIPTGFTKVLLSISATYANEQNVSGGYRAVIDTNGTNATDSFKVWVYNAAGTKVTSSSFIFSFIAIGY